MKNQNTTNKNKIIDEIKYCAKVLLKISNRKSYIELFYKHINNELQDIVKVFFNEYKDLIKPNNNDIFLTFTDETNNIFDSYGDVKFYDKKDARAFVNAVRVVNKKLNKKYNDDWHNYYDYSE